MRAHPDDPCPPKVDSHGKPVEMVRVPTAKGGTRCVKAGGKASKEHGVCPKGKVLITATYRVPQHDGSVRTVTGTRCVRPTGKYEHLKKCPPGQVLVEQMRHGWTPGHPSKPWSKAVRLCVTEQTAHSGGYTIVG